MNTYEIHDGDLLISDDKALLDRALIHGFLSERSYWAQGVSRDIVERAIDQSLCFGIYSGGRQTGFARVVTDSTTFAWLADVFVIETERGHWSEQNADHRRAGASAVAGLTAVHAGYAGRAWFVHAIWVSAGEETGNLYGNSLAKHAQTELNTL